MTETLIPRPANGSAGGSSVSTYLGESFLSDLRPSVRTRKVAILGFSETVKDAPVNDPSWELWAMNGFWRAAKLDFGIDVPEDRYSLWFDMHTLDYTREYGAKAGFGDAQEKWLREPHPFPILMLQGESECPSVTAFPLEDVIASCGRDYFTSTVSYAIAYAAMQPDVAEIGLWGIDLVHDSEYADQRPCAEWHLALAESRGIKITTHEKSALLKQRHRYGYEMSDPFVADLRKGLETQRDALVKTLNDEQTELERLRAQIATNDGARQMVEMLLSRLSLYERGGRI